MLSAGTRLGKDKNTLRLKHLTSQIKESRGQGSPTGVVLFDLAQGILH